jgi:hypothetical protein
MFLNGDSQGKYLHRLMEGGVSTICRKKLSKLLPKLC